ncbi:MAG: efflux RND transporter periplasmic adaptor subunit [Beijerinckiaceae bacterium]|nr:efflux RND transporter periplasmic adaptor subunit [Beijerinckiaceae bacterium]
MKIRTRALQFAALGCALFLVAGCNEPQSDLTTEAKASLPQVAVITVQPSPRPIVRELPGRIAPTRVAEIRARVAGIVMQRLFEQGAEVKAGDVLYRIDPAKFEVELDAAEAALAKAKAALEQADKHAKRVEKLIQGRVASQAQYDNVTGAFRQAQAEVAAREADVARAKLDLDYTTVRSPISGRIGGALVTEGALVGQGEATHLATVQQLDPIYADFIQSVSELRQLRRDFESGALEQISPDSTKVRLELDDGTLYPYPGRLLFSDATVDRTTGQVTLRGEFPNPKHELLPGMYVRIRIEQGIDSDSLAIPQQAVRRSDTGGDEVYVLRDDNHAVVQPVRLGHLVDEHWLVREGLKPGDRVVVEGFQKFAAGEVVDPIPWSRAVSASAAKESSSPKTD